MMSRQSLWHAGGGAEAEGAGAAAGDGDGHGVGRVVDRGSDHRLGLCLGHHCEQTEGRQWSKDAAWRMEKTN